MKSHNFTGQMIETNKDGDFEIWKHSFQVCDAAY